MNDFFIKDNLSDYTEYEFIEFVKEIFKEDAAPTDVRADILLFHFRKIIGHPGGADLIYHPELGKDTSAEGITKTIKEWREYNGLPGFKRE